MKRRDVLSYIGAASFAGLCHGTRASAERGNLSSVPVELRGDWKSLHPHDVASVLRVVRDSCLDGVRLLSDRPPKFLIVENRVGGPAIWLHAYPMETAWIVVSIDGPHWIQLAYQFGHELGHVLCNSWDESSRPGPPSQWVEEAVVEAFSLRGLAILAASWERSPPFPRDSAYAAAIRQYRRALLAGYMSPVLPPGEAAEWDHWLSLGWKPQDPPSGSSHQKGPLTLSILQEMEANVAAVEDLGALNRWESRTRVPVAEYLGLWEASCREVGSFGLLPRKLRQLFGL